MRTVLMYRRRLLAYSETFIRSQVLASRRWRTVLAGAHRIDGLDLAGIDIRLLEKRQDRIGLLLSSLRYRLGLPPALAMLRRERPSLVHAHFGTDSLEAAVIARALGVPLLVTLYGYDITIDRVQWESGSRGLTMRDYPRRLQRLAQQPDVHFIAISEVIRRQAIAWGIAPGKIDKIYLDVDTMVFRPGPVPVAERAPRILFVGRLVEKKGCEYLIRAFTRVLEDVPEAQLVIAGDGTLRQSLEQLARAAGQHVTFLGRATPDMVKAELSQARVFCLPGVRSRDGDAEGLGVVVLEAQACGLPVVTSAAPAVEEGIIDGLTGFSFAERDIEALAARLTRLLRDGRLAERMGQEGRRLMEARFDIRSCTVAREALYDRLAGPS